MDVSNDIAAMGPSRRQLWLGTLSAALGTGVVLLATSAGVPMVWDEGNAIVRSEGVTRWAGRWSPGAQNGEDTGPLGREAIAADWPYTTQREGHPAFYGIVIAAGHAVSGGWLSPLESYRFGPIVLFGVAVGAMYYRLAREYSMAAAAGAVVSLLLLPRMFAHAHFASFDGPLVSCWILTWAAFAPAITRAHWAVVWGVVLGMTLSCKATGWLAPVPFLIWAAAYRDRQAVRALVIGLPVALVVFGLLNPPLWHEPIRGFWQFFTLNLHRQAQGLNISTQFLGQLHNLDHPLPWYNTLLWTGVTVPIGIVFLLLAGFWNVFRRPWSKPGMLLVGNWLVLLVVRAMPGVPPHDGVRLFLPSFAFLAALAGLGVEQVFAVARSGREGRGARSGRGRAVAILAVAVIFGGSATSLVWYAPQWLSYYNLAIGGLPGAVRLGMEPTYYWDGLDRSVLDWLNRHTAPGEKVQFACVSQENLALLRRWGILGAEFREEAAGEFRWYVVQHRPSAWQPADRWLLEHEQPIYRKCLRDDGVGPWCLDVPLVDIYSYEQFRRAYEAAGF